MRVLITGAAGFLGWKLMRRLARTRRLNGPQVPVSELVLFDTVEPPSVEEPTGGELSIRRVVADLTDAEAIRAAVGTETDSVFHLAAVVSGAAEADFDLGMRVNLHGSLNLFEACRLSARCPRVVFASSIAVYGGETIIDDRTPATPLNSYGIQKAAVEHLLSDYSRRGFLDGRALRFPTIAVRPGRPNATASSFVSAVIREPLAGKEAVCPVRPDSVMPILSPARALNALVHAHDLDGKLLGSRRVDTWPRRLDSRRAGELGFRHDASVAEIIDSYITAELGGRTSWGQEARST